VAVPVVTAAEVLHPGTNRGPNGEHGDELVIAAGLEAAPPAGTFTSSMASQ
jgi:hypothetical protein